MTSAVARVDGAAAAMGEMSATALPVCVGGEGFKPPRAYPVGSNPAALAIGDFNSDMQSDLAAANRGGDSVSIVLGNGDGTFQPAISYTVGAQPASLTVGDFNKDARADLAVANRVSDTVSVLLGNGDGTFQPAMNYPVGENVTAVATGDLNGDTNLDLVVALIGDGGNHLGVLLGNGDGTFQPVDLNAVSNQPLSVVVVDLNRDGKLDLASANNGPATLNVLLGNGDGTFQAPKSYTTNSGAFFVVVGDFNADASPDLVVVNGNINVSVFLGNGDGTFQARSDYPVGIGPDTAAVGDVNGDSRLDVLVSNFQASNVSVLLGKGDGTFQPAINYDAGLSPTAVTVGRFNADERLDFAVVHYYYDYAIGVVLQRSPATHLRVDAPARTNPGSPINLTVTALDALDVPVPAYTCTVHFSSSDPTALLSADDDFNLGDEGTHTFNGFILHLPGAQRLTVEDRAVPSISGSAQVIVSGRSVFIPFAAR